MSEVAVLPESVDEFIVERGALGRPIQRALWLAGSYLLFASLYILLSTYLVGHLSASVRQAQYFEMFKGLAFVAVTALLFFLLCLSLLRQIQAHEVQIARQVDALNRSDRAMLTGMFAGAIAHDINNALAMAQLTVDQLREEVVPGSRQEQLVRDIANGLANAAAWNQRTFEIGFRRVAQDKALFDVRDLVVNTVSLARRHESLRQSQVTLEVPREPMSYLGNANLIRRALLNLLLNAGQAAGAGGKVHTQLLAGPAGEVGLVVDDNGPGVPTDVRGKVLEPFYTTKVDGTGIGLASVQSCANFHQGRLEISDSPVGGARFTLWLARVNH